MCARGPTSADTDMIHNAGMHPLLHAQLHALLLSVDSGINESR
jgi:hypothetical protein